MKFILDVVLFEVMDKEPGIVTIWLLSLAIGIVGLALGMLNRWFAVAAVIVSLLLVWILQTEFRDPQINPHIWNETPFYLPQTYLAMAISLILPLTSILITLRTSKSIK